MISFLLLTCCKKLEADGWVEEPTIAFTPKSI